MTEKDYQLYTLHIQLEYPDLAPVIVDMTNQYIDEDWIDYAQALMMLRAILNPEPDD